MAQLEWTFLGRVDYPTAMEYQTDHAKKVARGADPRLYLMEHPPTITLGRMASDENLLLSEAQYAELGFGVFRVLRGGDVTYHGPGQLVGYPVASLAAVGCSIGKWVRGHAEAIVDYLLELGVEARWSDDHPGVWVGREKIAAVGFHISRRVSTHGFALNLQPDLSHYRTIVPCGLQGRGVTSLAELGLEVPEMSRAAADLARRIASRFGWDMRPMPDAGGRERKGAEEVALQGIH